MSLKALIFDMDGTLANTEHDGHLRAFNETFKLFELDWHWDSELYSDLLNVSGGKERLAHYISHYNPNLERNLSVNDIADIHNKKTEIFVNHVANGEVSLRFGVDRLIKEAIVSGLRLGIATTTSLKNVEALMTSTLGEYALDKFEVIGAGAVVKSKKPAADIYRYVIDKMRLSCHECIAFEDSQIGFASATSRQDLRQWLRLVSIIRNFFLKGHWLCLTIWEMKINPLKSLKVVRQIIHLSV